MTNKQAFDEAKIYIPGGVDSPVRAFGNVGHDPFVVKSGKGAYIKDIEGNTYLDFIQSWGPLIFGHCDKDIESAIIEAVKNGTSFGAPCELETTLAKLILKDFPHLDQIRFVNSGTEATMSAIRLARGYAKKDGIIKFEGCYHGHSDSLLVKAGSGASTFGSASSAGVPEDVVKNTHLAIYNDLQSVKDIISKHQIAAIIVEPIAGNMGLVSSKPEFLKGLREICDKFNIVLILDEVMSGYRASKLGSYGVYGVKGDIVTFGKVIGGGMNAAAFAGKKEIMSHISPLGEVYQAGTLSGNPVAMAAGIASLSKIDSKDGLYDRLESLAVKFTDGFKALANKKGVALQTRVVGSMMGYFFNNSLVQNYADALRSDTEFFAKFHQAVTKNGLFMAPSLFETSFICDAMQESDIDYALDKIEKSFKEI
ncbi:MAG: glutamate-1-semialdehyde 2,1-aminomutase [Campylobacter sp.]|nr:glutamate-1-semialdehyde 2,1-aminomutase [Campylobacter sp.]